MLIVNITPVDDYHPERYNKSFDACRYCASYPSKPPAESTFRRHQVRCFEVQKTASPTSVRSERLNDEGSMRPSKTPHPLGIGRITAPRPYLAGKPSPASRKDVHRHQWRNALPFKGVSTRLFSKTIREDTRKIALTCRKPCSANRVKNPVMMRDQRALPKQYAP
jgi:hypothetical protein